MSDSDLPPTSDASALKKELKHYRTVSLGILGLVFTVGLFKLSSSVILSQRVKYYCSIVTAVVFVLAVVTVAASYSAKATDANIDMICSALCLLTLYVINALFLIIYSFSYWPGAKSDRHYKINILIAGSGSDVAVFLLWVNSWKRPKLAYNCTAMKKSRTIAWILVKLLVKALVSIFKGIYGFFSVILCGLYQAIKQIFSDETSGDDS